MKPGHLVWLRRLSQTFFLILFLFLLVESRLPQDILFDYTQAMERVAGDRELLKELLEIFYDDVPNRLTQLGRAVSEGDAECVRQEAHTLKGALLNLGLEQCAGTALTIEKGAKAGEHHRDYRALCEELRSSLRELLALSVADSPP